MINNTMKKLCIAIPTHDGRLHAPTSLSIIELSHRLLQEYGVPSQVGFVQHTGIAMARNLICKSFLETDASHLLMIDADQTFNVNSMLAAIKLDTSCLGFAVRRKTSEVKYNIRLKPNELLCHKDSEICLRVAGVGTGIFLIERKVLEKLETMSRRCSTSTVENIAIFFEEQIVPSPEGDRWLSEDLTFCQKVTEIGYDVFAYCCPHTGHIGDYTYKGNYIRDLASAAGVT